MCWIKKVGYRVIGIVKHKTQALNLNLNIGMRGTPSKTNCESKEMYRKRLVKFLCSPSRDETEISQNHTSTYCASRRSDCRLPEILQYFKEVNSCVNFDSVNRKKCNQ